MKTIVINASPRKKWNTAEIMEAAQKGAESVGAETEYINLYDLVFKGCRSCLVCKLKDKPKGKCYWNNVSASKIFSINGDNSSFQ